MSKKEKDFSWKGIKRCSHIDCERAREDYKKELRQYVVKKRSTGKLNDLFSAGLTNAYIDTPLYYLSCKKQEK